MRPEPFGLFPCSARSVLATVRDASMVAYPDAINEEAARQYWQASNRVLVLFYGEKRRAAIPAYPIAMPATKEMTDGLRLAYDAVVVLYLFARGDDPLDRKYLPGETLTLVNLVGDTSDVDAKYLDLWFDHTAGVTQ